MPFLLLPTLPYPLSRRRADRATEGASGGGAVINGAFRTSEKAAKCNGGGDAVPEMASDKDVSLPS